MHQTTAELRRVRRFGRLGVRPSIALPPYDRSESDRHPRDPATAAAAQERGELRDDQPAERIAGFISLVANGIVMQVGLGERVRDVDALI